MKKLLIIYVLILSVNFSTSSVAGWTELTKSVSGDTFYVDYTRMRKHEGYVSYWTLSDFLIPTKWGDFSIETYRQGDCKSFRFRNLRFVQYKQKMGQGNGDVYRPVNIKWNYPPAQSVNDVILKVVCSR